jgi:50S ribosomal protein L16 3-hydroxylase
MYQQSFESIDKQAFLTNYWQKSPCVFRRAFTPAPNLLSADELAGLSLEPDVESRLIQQSPTTNQWQLDHGPFEQQVFSQLAESHWTLLVQSVDSWIPESLSLMQHFSFIPKWRLDDLMVSYATDQGGVGPHFDNFDVFLIQGMGKRDWQIGQPGKATEQSEVSAGLSQMKPFAPFIQVELNPGDMLYVPPKTAHWGISIGESIGYSVGFRSPETAHLISLIAEHMQSTGQFSEFFSDAYRNSLNHNNQLEPQLTQWAQQQLKKLSEQPELLNKLLCSHLSNSKLGLVEQTNSFNIQDVSDDCMLKIQPQLSVIWQLSQDKILLCIEGEDFHFEKYLITAIEKLANFEACPAKLFKYPPTYVDFPEDLSTLIDRGYVNRVS